MPPDRAAVAIRAGYVGDRAVVHHGARHASLLRAVPDDRIAGAALMISVEPSGRLAQTLHVLDRSDAASEVADVHRVGTRLGDDCLPAFPHVEHPRHVHFVVLAIQRARRVGPIRRHAADLIAIHPLTALTVADGEISGTRPPVREEAVDRIARVDLAINRRHLIGEVRAEHARLVEPGRFAVRTRRSVAIALEPQNLPNVAIANFWDVENVIPVIRGNKVSPILIIRILDN